MGCRSRRIPRTETGLNRSVSKTVPYLIGCDSRIYCASHGGFHWREQPKGQSEEDAPTIPPVIREAPNYPITLPMTGQFLAMAACATSPVPPATGRVAPPSNESLRRHVAGSRPARQIDALGRLSSQRVGGWDRSRP